MDTLFGASLETELPETMSGACPQTKFLETLPGASRQMEVMETLFGASPQTGFLETVFGCWFSGCLNARGLHAVLGGLDATGLRGGGRRGRLAGGACADAHGSLLVYGGVYFVFAMGFPVTSETK